MDEGNLCRRLGVQRKVAVYPVVVRQLDEATGQAESGQAGANKNVLTCDV